MAHPKPPAEKGPIISQLAPGCQKKKSELLPSRAVQEACYENVTGVTRPMLLPRFLFYRGIRLLIKQLRAASMDILLAGASMLYKVVNVTVQESCQDFQASEGSDIHGPEMTAP